jgi:hydroxymethylpyrimidine pyrophosphatase-like HAD family hydrolase
MNGMDVMAAGVSKLTGIQTLLDQWGLAFDDVAAFGDNGNDFEMVNAAHEGFAMKNAAQDLLARVDHVTDLTNDESGVQERIDHYLSEK